ncbi:winged helix-turn-helix domain-containing protein [Enterobacter kobei]|uniref:winged helix-turn-helix domain-containing protein n=1 Tax=Enterobacter kobei TaxID=208224 RepID=UPI002FD69D1F
MKISFDISKNTLFLDNKKVRLNQQLARFLEYLCYNQDSTVSKESLLEECWRKRGVVVSDNAVRQSVFRVRKTFVELGFNEAVLISVGKSGYCLRGGVVELIKDESGNNKFSDDPGKSNNLNTKLLDKYKKNRRVYCLTGTLFTKRMQNRTIFFLFVFCLFFSFAALLRIDSLITDVNYKFVKKVNDRAFYTHISGFKNLDKIISQIEGGLKENNLSIAESRFVYLNYSSDAVLNMFVCDTQIEEKNNNCINFTAFGVLK